MRGSRPAAPASGAITTPSASSSSSAARASKRPPSRRAAAAAFPTHFLGDEEPRAVAAARVGDGATAANDAAASAAGAASRPSRVSRMKTRADSKAVNNKKRKGRADAAKDDAPAVASKVARLQMTTAAPSAAAATGPRAGVAEAGTSTRATSAAKDRSNAKRQPQQQQPRRAEAEAEAPAEGGQGSSNHTSAQSRSDPISTSSDQPSWSRRKPTPPRYQAGAARAVELVPALTSATDIDVSAPAQQPVQEHEHEPIARVPPPAPVTTITAKTTTTVPRRVLAPETPAEQERRSSEQERRQQQNGSGQVTPTRPRGGGADRSSSPRRQATTSRRLGVGFGQPITAATARTGHGAPPLNRRLGALGARPVVSQSIYSTSSQQPGTTTMLEVDEAETACPAGMQAAGLDDGFAYEDIAQTELPSPELPVKEPAPVAERAASPKEPPAAVAPLNQPASEAPAAQELSAAASSSSPSSSAAALDGRYVVTVERWRMASDDADQGGDATSASSANDRQDHDAAAAAAAKQIDHVLAAADDEYRRSPLAIAPEASNRLADASTAAAAGQEPSAIGKGKLVPVKAKVWRRGRGKHPTAAMEAVNSFRFKGVGPPKRSAVVRWMKRWGIGVDEG